VVNQYLDVLAGLLVLFAVALAVAGKVFGLEVGSFLMVVGTFLVLYLLNRLLLLFRKG
jgi:hypothetical protein